MDTPHRTLNLGILAHVDAGKTTLTERLLYEAGVISRVGSVDDGNTQTDSLDLERQRGITIKAAVVSFEVNGRTVNLIDTPGHPDFIAEVERALRVLDGAVLVVSAVEGVQPQTRILMRSLQRLRIPTVIFVNKIDRTGAQHDQLMSSMSEKLTSSIVAMGQPRGLGNKGAKFDLYTDEYEHVRARLLESLADDNDDLLAAYVSGTDVSPPRLRQELAKQTELATAHPVYFGSAVTGAGVHELMTGIAEFLPATTGEDGGPPSGTVFKVERGPSGQRIAYVRMFSGRINVRDRVRVGDSDHERKVTAITVFENGKDVRSSSVAVGQIGKLWGLDDVQIDDVIGDGKLSAQAEHHFAPPTLESVVVPRNGSSKGAAHLALAQLAEQDPLINLRQNDNRDELYLSLYGEVQKEVIQQTLATEHNVEVEFRESRTICIERPSGTGAAVEIGKTESNPHLATVGLRVDPAPLGSGVSFHLEVELGSMPYSFFAAVEESVHKALEHGPQGWRVIDCVVTMTHSGYWPRQSHAHQGFNKAMSSTAGDFRTVTPMVLAAALRRAGTDLYEPMHRFRVELSTEAVRPMLAALAKAGATPGPPEVQGSVCWIDGDIPAASIHGLQVQLPALTHGEGVLESHFSHYSLVRR